MPDTYYGVEPPAPGWSSDANGAWTPPAKPRIALIGGGPGALFTAYILNQKYPEAKLALFEASSRLGGKIKTDEFSDGTPFESGVAELYEYLGPGSRDPLRQLIEDDLGLHTRNIAGGCVVLGEDILRDLDEVEKKYGAATREKIERFHAKCAELMPLEKYAHRWQPDNSHPWASKTFHECIEEECGDDPVVRSYITTAIHSDLATEPHTCNGLNGIKNALMDNDQYMQLYHVIGGIGQVASRLEELVEVSVQKETRVLKIDKSDGDRYLLTSISGGKRHTEEFDFVFLCVPNHWYTQIDFAIPSLKEALCETQRHYDLPAHYLRVSLLYEKPWWKRLKIPGEFWMMDVCNGCCVYDESARWKSKGGHVLSFLLGGQDALLLCSSNQDDECIVRHLLDCLPDFMQEDATKHLVEAQVDRFAGSINAQPGGWPAEELRAEHWPDPEGCPGVFLVGDFLFDSTLNAALISANTAVDLLLEHVKVEPGEVTDAIEDLTPDGAQLGMVGDEWHGPEAPGPGWVQTGQGERGGKVWKRQGQSAPQETAKPPQPAGSPVVDLKTMSDEQLQGLLEQVQAALTERQSRPQATASGPEQPSEPLPAPLPGTPGGPPLEVPPLVAEQPSPASRRGGRTAEELAADIPKVSGNMPIEKARVIIARAEEAARSLTTKEFERWAALVGVSALGSGATKAMKLQSFKNSVNQLAVSHGQTQFSLEATPPAQSVPGRAGTS